MKRCTKVLGTIAVLVTGVGCAPGVIDHAQQDPGQGDAPAGVTTIALLARDLPPGKRVQGLAVPWPSVSDPAPFTVDPEALVLMFSNRPEPCADPQIGSDGANAAWQAMLVVPPDLARPGRLDLSDPRIWYLVWTYADTGIGGGYSDAFGATLDIASADASSVGVKLSGLVASIDLTPDVILEGSYTIPRCAPAAAPSP
jgi:hypothetical protein